METIKVPSVKTDLKDRVLWYDGDSTVTEDFLVDRVASGESVAGLFVEEITPQIRQFNNMVPKDQRVEIKTEVSSLDLSFNLPKGYGALNVEETVQFLLDEEAKSSNFSAEDLKIRVDRVDEELHIYKKLGLLNVLRTLLYIINTFYSNNVVWGVGRGSSVSSYVLYLIGVHDVDSVEYDLDIGEFLRLG